MFEYTKNFRGIQKQKAKLVLITGKSRYASNAHGLITTAFIRIFKVLNIKYLDFLSFKERFAVYSEKKIFFFDIIKIL